MIYLGATWKQNLSDLFCCGFFFFFSPVPDQDVLYLRLKGLFFQTLQGKAVCGF